MSDRLLPAEFSELEPFAKKWALVGEDERFACRLASSMDEIEAFYTAMMARAPRAIEYLNQFELAQIPEDGVRLLRMLYSLITVSFCVDTWKNQRVPDAGAAYLTAIVEPAI